MDKNLCHVNSRVLMNDDSRPSIRSFFKSETSLPAKDDEIEDEKAPSASQVVIENENTDDSPPVERLSPFKSQDVIKPLELKSLANRSQFTNFFCKTRTPKSSQKPSGSSPTKEDFTVESPTSEKSPESPKESLPVQVKPLVFVISSSDSQEDLQKPKPTSIVLDDDECVVLGSSFKAKRPKVEPRPVAPKQNNFCIDLTDMDPALMELVKAQSSVPAPSVTKDDENRNVMFKIVPRMELARPAPLFIRTRVNDSFGQLKAKVAKELHTAVENLVLVYDNVALIDISRPSTFNFIGSKKNADKSKAIDLDCFTKASWRQEQQNQKEKRQVILENVQFLSQTPVEEVESESDLESLAEPAPVTAQDLNISIRTNRTGLQSFHVQVPSEGTVKDIVQAFKDLQKLKEPLTAFKVKFDGDLLNMNMVISSILENNDMVDLFF